MIIVIESGSTKADWVVIESDGSHTITSTEGINPTTQHTLMDLYDHPELRYDLSRADQIHFYGAGVVTSESKNKIKSWLLSTDTEAKIYIESDALAAARSSFAEEDGILVILGTGSYASIYRDGRLAYSIPSMGYILSDEGGGCHLGKEVLKSFIYGSMPVEVCEVFIHRFGAVTRDDVLTQLYSHGAGSKYLASFSQILSDIDHPWCDAILSYCFEEFVLLRLKPLLQHGTYPIRCCGSIAHYYQSPLRRVAASHGIHIDDIVQKPIEKLIQYHKHYIFAKYE
jgi:glucosamine kinase